VRLGAPRAPGEGPRLGTVRRPPRGVKKADFAKRDYYDLWLPVLAPTQGLVSRAMRQDWTAARWAKFERAYRREMGAPVPAQVIALLAAMSHHTNLSIGCYCEDESRCHRSVLKKLLIEKNGVCP
jgi:uncharacterized protein YeaO (DUF488 family)